MALNMQYLFEGTGLRKNVKGQAPIDVSRTPPDDVSAVLNRVSAALKKVSSGFTSSQFDFIISVDAERAALIVYVEFRPSRQVLPIAPIGRVPDYRLCAVFSQSECTTQGITGCELLTAWIRLIIDWFGSLKDQQDFPANVMSGFFEDKLVAEVLALREHVLKRGISKELDGVLSLSAEAPFIYQKERLGSVGIAISRMQSILVPLDRLAPHQLEVNGRFGLMRKEDADGTLYVSAPINAQLAGLTSIDWDSVMNSAPGAWLSERCMSPDQAFLCMVKRLVKKLGHKIIPGDVHLEFNELLKQYDMIRKIDEQVHLDCVEELFKLGASVESNSALTLESKSSFLPRIRDMFLLFLDIE